MINELLLDPIAMAFLSGFIVGLIVPDEYGRMKLRGFGIFIIDKLPGEMPKGEDNE